MEGLRRLLKQAAAMEQSAVVDVVSRRVRELLTATHDWETEAKAALKQRYFTYVCIYIQLLYCLLYAVFCCLFVSAVGFFVNVGESFIITLCVLLLLMVETPRNLRKFVCVYLCVCYICLFT